MIPAFYRHWHQHPHHPFWHWIVFSFVAVFVFNHLYVRIGDYLNEEILSLNIQTPQAQAAGNTYYVSPSGSGTTCTNTSPCTVAQALSMLKASDTIWANDGYYTGASGMLQPATGLKGTAALPITFQAVNDGKVWIDGQGVTGREVCRFFDNDYWVIEGINCSNSGTMNGHGPVSTYLSDNMIFRRVVAWNAPVAENAHVWQISTGCGNVFEDVAGFGTGRKIFENFDSRCTATTRNIYRRAWGQFEKTTVSPALTQTFDAIYSSWEAIVENSILTWDQQAGANMVEPFGAGISGGGLGYYPGNYANLKYYGNILYLPSGKTFSPTQLGLHNGVGGYDIKNLAVFLPTDQSTKYPIQLGHASGMSPPNNAITNASLIGGQTSPINAIWTQNNVRSGSSVSAVYGSQSLYLNDGTKGATICYRYKDGVLTNGPLWPWPMNQRIKDAMAQSGRTPVDVTATIESMFGIIPSQCKIGANPTPTPVISPTVTTNKSSYLQGETITVMANSGLSNVQEWVALYVSSNSDSSWSFEGNWKYLNGTQTAPTSPVPYPAVLSFTAPSTSGTYNFRYFAQNGFSSRLAISSDLVITSSSCDLNQDFQTNILDFQLLANVILGLTPNTGIYDINKDGQVNILDTQVLANVTLGKSSCP